MVLSAAARGMLTVSKFEVTQGLNFWQHGTFFAGLPPTSSPHNIGR